MADNTSESGFASFVESWKGFAEGFSKNSEKISFDWSANVANIRRGFFQLSQAIEPDLPQMQSVDNMEIPTSIGAISARVYTPHKATYPIGPGLVFYHGGGFIMGDLESYDSICRRLADASGCRVLSIEYHLAPEFKFPSQVNEAIEAFNWAVANSQEWGADPERIAVGGDSAGGNLTMVVTQSALQGECPMPAYQLLIYPLAQFVDLKDKGVPLQEGSFFSPAVFNFCKTAYLEKGQDPADVRISPLFAEDFKGLPPAHIITAGWDPLRDEGKAYADKLSAAGVRVSQQDFPSQPHGFFNTVAVSKSARDAIAATGEILESALSN